MCLAWRKCVYPIEDSNLSVELQCVCIILLLAVHVHFLESYCVRAWKVYTSIGNLIFVWWVTVKYGVFKKANVLAICARQGV